MELKLNHLSSDTLKSNQSAAHALYQRYGGMLLGYITEVVKDAKLAEQYLIEVFKQALHMAHQINQSDNAWLKLQRLAKNELTKFNQEQKTDGSLINTSRNTITNSFLKLMNNGQQYVFCGIHYQQKNTSLLATELNVTEDAIRQLLREALTIIRNEQKR